jgi:hypothetical protein
VIAVAIPAAAPPETKFIDEDETAFGVAGFGATAARDAPYAGLYVLFYEQLKRRFALMAGCNRVLTASKGLVIAVAIPAAAPPETKFIDEDESVGSLQDLALPPLAMPHTRASTFSSTSN